MLRNIDMFPRLNGVGCFWNLLGAEFSIDNLKRLKKLNIKLCLATSCVPSVVTGCSLIPVLVTDGQ